MTPADKIVERLEKCRKTGADKWLACCPAHDDRTPSLSIKELPDGRALIHCHGGCAPLDILAAIGLEMTDLFSEPPANVRGIFGSRKRGVENITEDEWLVEICKDSRKNGKRLTPEEKKLELEAILRIKRRRSA